MWLLPVVWVRVHRAFDTRLLEYGDDYDNTQSHSPSFKAYLDMLVQHLVEQRGVGGARVVEVGCGNGDFLRRLVAADSTIQGWGFDPSHVGPETELDGRLRFRRELYGPGCEATHADVVVCRHVIEHVADPLALLATVRAALERSPQARVFFETPSLEWILHHRVSWDLFYEHCSLFTEQSLATAFTRAGFRTVEVSRSFGDQYLWLEARLETDPSRERHAGSGGHAGARPPARAGGSGMAIRLDDPAARVSVAGEPPSGGPAPRA